MVISNFTEGCPDVSAVQLTAGIYRLDRDPQLHLSAMRAAQPESVSSTNASPSEPASSATKDSSRMKPFAISA
jgi:hypothetical protein